LVHELRARSDGILVGINTVITDDPLLTVRGVPEARKPVRFVLDSHLLLPECSQLATTASDFPLVVACHATPRNAQALRVSELTEQGVVFVVWPDGDSGIPLEEFMNIMFGSDVLEDVHLDPFTHLLVEPGPTLARSFFRDGLCDRLWLFR